MKSDRHDEVRDTAEASSLDDKHDGGINMEVSSLDNRQNEVRDADMDEVRDSDMAEASTFNLNRTVLSNRHWNPASQPADLPDCGLIMPKY